MMNRLSICKRLPKHIKEKAEAVYLSYMVGEIAARGMNYDSTTWVLNVGRDWRLLSTDNGYSFKLISHEKYNKAIK